MTDALSGITGTPGSSAPSATKKRNGEIGQTEFLNLLVAQLKNQDPLEPMKNEDFAVNLAQFSQLERLISIDDSLKNNESGGSASLASYLGYEVSLSGSDISVAGGDGGSVRVALPEEASRLAISIRDKNGVEAERLVFEELAAGRHTFDLKNLQLRNGDYTVKAEMTNREGKVSEALISPAGIVSGFIPGPEPRLIVGRREVPATSVSEVSVPRENPVTVER